MKIFKKSYKYEYTPIYEGKIGKYTWLEYHFLSEANQNRRWFYNKMCDINHLRVATEPSNIPFYDKLVNWMLIRKQTKDSLVFM